ncbi:MAG TPA: tRNA 2-thiouridine(34) synthase MnmA [Clostridiales bacterium]|nr:tRNA 2-thiouridine(34) synthase MnmA [Clostridiales bacterium]
MIKNRGTHGISPPLGCIYAKNKNKRGDCVAEKVMVGMSGGVDSSVAALVLQRQGYDVCSATLRLFNNDDVGLNDRTRTCCSLEDVEDARSVAYKLNINHYVFNFSDQFKEQVIKRFANSYERGETPNPCIECNRYIKFGKMIERAAILDCDYIATGHYVKRQYDSVSGRYLLKKATDNTKDQTYMLYPLTQKMLAKTLFPLGDMHKSQARDLAEEANLINARKPDSQDICFVKDGDYAGFLEKIMGVKSPQGSFIYKDGTILGKHKGIIHYTIGQRKGLGISYEHPLFVLDKNSDTNVIKLGENQDLFSNRLIADDVNYVAVDTLTTSMKVTAKARYSQKESPAVVHPLSEAQVMVEFKDPQRAITKGQAVVFYDGDIVVGGGTIR